MVLALGVVFAWTLLGPEQGAATVVLIGGIVLWMLAGAWRGGSWAGGGRNPARRRPCARRRSRGRGRPTSPAGSADARGRHAPGAGGGGRVGDTPPAYGHRRARAEDTRGRQTAVTFAGRPGVRAPSTAAIGAWPALHQVGAVYLGPFLRSRYPRWFDPLADYLRADPRFFAAFADEESGTILFVRRDVARVMDAWRSETPALRSNFDVFVLDDVLVYAKESCGEEDRRRRFFVHVVPADPADLQPPSRERGFENGASGSSSGVSSRGRGGASQRGRSPPMSSTMCGPDSSYRGTDASGRGASSSARPRGARINKVNGVIEKSVNGDKVVNFDMPPGCTGRLGRHPRPASLRQIDDPDPIPHERPEVQHAVAL